MTITCLDGVKKTVWPWKYAMFNGNSSSKPYLAGSNCICWRVTYGIYIEFKYTCELWTNLFYIVTSNPTQIMVKHLFVFLGCFYHILLYKGPQKLRCKSVSRILWWFRRSFQLSVHQVTCVNLAIVYRTLTLF